MVSSVLSPEKIVGRQNKNRQSAQNFISGGSLLGSSVVSNAANKIVGFQRANVKPSVPAMGGIISAISTSVNNNVTNVINKTLQGFTADYQRRVSQVDDAKPTGILGKFLNVYKTALGFINFFGNKRNIDKVRDNLEALKKSFTESFEVAKLIRQVIIKIVKQLSNLPVASPSGGGGLNLDIDIPGGGLRRSAPRGLSGMKGGGKGKILALGAGALGLGALGAGAVNALQDDQQVQTAQTTPNIPGDDVDRFASIVDRFANVIGELFKINKEPKKKGGGPSGTPSSGGRTGGSETQSPYGDTSRLSASISSNEEDLLMRLMIAEAGGEGEMGMAAVARSVLNRAGLVQSGKVRPGTFNASGGSISDIISAPEQYTPFSQGKLNRTLSQDEVRRAKAALEIAKNQADMRGRLESANVPASTINLLMASTGFRNASIARRDSTQEVNQTLFGRHTFNTAGNVGNITPSSVRFSPLSTKPQTQVVAAPTATEIRQQLAQQVSQPPPSQQQQQPVVMPIDLSGGGQQQTRSGGGMSSPPPQQGNGPSVPFLPAANTDNFLVLYSRMVYNIVDG